MNDWDEPPEQATPAPQPIREVDPDLERLLAEEEDIERRTRAGAGRAGPVKSLRGILWFDEDNNFAPPAWVWDDPNGAVGANKVNSLRLSVAAELMRNKIYGRGGVNAAIDDADSALGFLFRVGILTIDNIK